MPRFRQPLLTLSIAMYPLLVTSLWRLCLHTITPTGASHDAPDGHAYTAGLSKPRLLGRTALTRKDKWGLCGSSGDECLE
jgi:hypothetical protein